MTLTRHFYDLQDVRSAFQYCLINGKALEASFWLAELIDSHEPDIAIGALIEVYLVRYGTSQLHWFLEIYKILKTNNIDDEILYILCISLCKLERNTDTSFLSLHFAGLRVSTKPPEGLPEKAADWIEENIKQEQGTSLFEIFFARSLFHRKIRNCMWVLSKCRNTFVENIIEAFRAHVPVTIAICIEAAKNLYTWSWLNYNNYSIIVFTLMIICLRPEDYSKSLTLPFAMEFSSNIYKHIIEWEHLLGTRSRRIYAIPNDCLYMVTDRGILPYTQNTYGYIRTLGSSIDNTYMALYNCTFWKMLWLKYNPHGTTDEGYDRFCEEAFPTDTPDEWSKEDQDKSHGNGINNPGERLYWRRWLRKWMNTNSAESNGAEKKYHLNNSHLIVAEEIEKFDLVLPKDYMSIEYLLQIITNTILTEQTHIFSVLDYSFLGQIEDKEDKKNENILVNSIHRMSLL
jgi:hypothetical protein